MKKISLFLLSVLLICTAFLTACNDPPPDGIKIKYTIDGYLHAQYTDSTVPTAPQKNSYEFDGWFFDEAFTVPFSYDKVSEHANGASEITVYGKWRLSGHSHRMVFKQGKAATCYEDGTVDHYICSDCNNAYLDEAGTVPLSKVTVAGGHQISYVAAKSPTCTEDGNIAHYYCSRCQKYYSDEAASSELTSATVKIPSQGHSYSDDWSFNGESHWHEATCGHESTGSLGAHTYQSGVCSVCGASEYSYLHFTLNGSSYSVKASDKARGMEEITVPAVYNSLPVTAIEANGFKELSSLRRLIISDSVTSVGANAFSDCYSLCSVTVGEAVAEIGEDAFLNCYSLVEVYNLSTSLTIDQNHQSGIASRALDIYTDESAESKLDEKDETYLFYQDGATVYLIKYLGGEKSVTLPGSFNSRAYEIYDYAFYASAITKVSFARSATVTAIGSYAFAECDKLTTVEIRKCVTTIEAYAFFGCDALADGSLKCEYKEAELPSGYSSDFNLRAPNNKIRVTYGFKPNNALPVQPFS